MASRYLANVHFCDIPHTFIPHFTLHSAEKIRIEFSANYPFTTFRIPHSAKTRESLHFLSKKKNNGKTDNFTPILIVLSFCYS